MVSLEKLKKKKKKIKKKKEILCLNPRLCAFSECIASGVHPERRRILCRTKRRLCVNRRQFGSLLDYRNLERERMSI